MSAGKALSASSAGVMALSIAACNAVLAATPAIFIRSVIPVILPINLNIVSANMSI